uniref:Serine O-acetyltransferase n=1 Tax=mine drainage metagenome TaxID=410659 RepID=E6Q716_9ZZZZ
MNHGKYRREELSRILVAQLSLVSPFGRYRDVKGTVGEALDRTQNCLETVVLPGYRADQFCFNPRHSDQYATYLYFVSNTAWRSGEDIDLAVDCYRLNKALHGLNCMYDTALPDVFVLIHTVGMVLGKADYGSHFVAYQNVTVGTDRGVRPRIGHGAVLFGGSMVLGNTSIGDRAVVSANSTVINQDVPADSIAAGASPNLTIKSRRRDFSVDYYDKSLGLAPPPRTP